MGYILILVLGVWMHAEPPRLVLISIDGFRWDYVDGIHTPNLDRLFLSGFRVQSMRPSFPSLTFANHYTLVTGKHPRKHGIVSNRFFDTRVGKSYSMYRPEDVTTPSWYLEPAIWEIAGRHKLTSAAYFWVGSEMDGRQPDVFMPFKYDTPIDEKVETLLGWLDPMQPPNPHLILAYFSFLDRAGHRYGPDAPEVIFAVQQVDALIGTLMTSIAQGGSQPNFLVVADHGMTAMSGTTMEIEDVLDTINKEDLIYWANNYSQLDLYLDEPTEAKIAEVLVKLPKREGFQWYRREAVPFGTHPTRNGHIMGLAALGYQFNTSKSRSKYRGGHGYDPRQMDMAAACFGFGPAFLPGSQLKQVDAVDIFPLLLHLLALPQMECDGSLSVWQPVLAATAKP